MTIKISENIELQDRCKGGVALHPSLHSEKGDDMINIRQNEFKKLVDYIESKYGINLSEKKVLVLSRLQNILLQKGFKSFEEYFAFVDSDKNGEEDRALINKLTTNHTYFLREIEHFKYFARYVLPYIVSVENNRDLRIWSAGCSSGEEPYTLSMVISDFFEQNIVKWNTKVLATDISTDVLNKASRGIYESSQIEYMPKEWKMKYLERIDDNNYAVRDNIKDNIIFRSFNLNNKEFPFKKRFHVIFCRNVMIYFSQGKREELVDRFYEFTEPGGFLFIGQSETLNRSGCRYKYVMPAVYRKE